jgi:TonB family protein
VAAARPDAPGDLAVREAAVGEAPVGEAPVRAEGERSERTDDARRVRQLGALAAAVALPAGVLAPGTERVVQPGDFAAGELGRARGLPLSTPAATRAAGEITLAGATPRYPAILRERKLDGEVVARFAVAADGRVDPASITIVRSTHVLFSQAVREALRRARVGDSGRGGATEPLEQTFRFQAPR